MIAVTGANGLLGSFIVRKLVEHNLNFIALKRKDSDTSLLQDIAPRITWVDADVLDLVALHEVFENVSHVIHAAAIVSFNPRRRQLIMNVNVEGTRNVVDACLSKGVKRLVHISSVSALGRQKNQNVIDEKNQWLESDYNSRYAESKYLAELEVFRGQEEGLSTVIINPSVILAPADWTKSSARLFRYVWEEKFLYSDGFLNFVDVRDVVEVMFQLLQSDIECQRFIVNAGTITFESFFTQIAERFDKKKPSLKVNPAVLKVVAQLETWRTWIFGGEPLLTKETARIAGSEFRYKNDKVKKTLSFEFQPVEKTLDWCCHSYMTKMTGKN